MLRRTMLKEIQRTLKSACSYEDFADRAQSYLEMHTGQPNPPRRQGFRKDFVGACKLYGVDDLAPEPTHDLRCPEKK